MDVFRWFVKLIDVLEYVMWIYCLGLRELGKKIKKLIVNVWINDSSNIVKYKGGVFCYLLNK